MKELSGRIEEAEEERQTERQARLRADNQRADLARQAAMYCTYNLSTGTLLVIKVIKVQQRKLQIFKVVCHNSFQIRAMMSPLLTLLQSSAKTRKEERLLDEKTDSIIG